jgi:hypothetical protein
VFTRWNWTAATPYAATDSLRAVARFRRKVMARVAIWAADGECAEERGSLFFVSPARARLLPPSLSPNNLSLTDKPLDARDQDACIVAGGC